MTVLKRLREVVKQILVSIDSDVQVIVVGALYLAHIVGTCPTADETISSYVGRGQRRDVWWARALAPAIDALFVVLGEAPGHCQRNVATAAAGKAPTA